MKATIVLPTTGDRAPLLPFSIASIQRQTITDLEIFVIGDGLDEATRETILQLQAKDSRIRLFDHPKHPRRGEVYRHAALAEACGEIVCYLCDRDLMLPRHVETLYGYLQGYDLVSSPHYRISREQKVSIGGGITAWYGAADSEAPAQARRGGHQLSSVGHTLAAYHELPEGWRTTPEGQFTDQYMWQQFLAQPNLKVYHAPHPCFLYFKRGDFPGWPVSKREPELRQWTEVLTTTGAWQPYADQAYCDLLNQVVEQQSRLGRKLLIRGRSPKELLHGWRRRFAR